LSGLQPLALASVKGPGPYGQLSISPGTGRPIATWVRSKPYLVVKLPSSLWTDAV
jgi:hypothetical protein